MCGIPIAVMHIICVSYFGPTNKYYTADEQYPVSAVTAPSAKPSQPTSDEHQLGIIILY